MLTVKVTRGKTTGDINLIVLSYQLFVFQGRNFREIMNLFLVLRLLFLTNCIQSLQFDCPEYVACDKLDGALQCFFTLRSDGIFSDPGDCQCMYECASGVPYQICCGEGIYNKLTHQLVLSP